MLPHLPKTGFFSKRIRHSMLIDMGFAAKCDSNEAMQHHDVGTPGLLAPELAKEKTPNDLKKADVFAFGLTLYSFCTGDMKEREFDKVDLQQAEKFISEIERLMSTKTSAFKEMIRGAIELDETKRDTMDQVMRRPWWNTVRH